LRSRCNLSSWFDGLEELTTECDDSRFISLGAFCVGGDRNDTGGEKKAEQDGFASLKPPRN
jgi:hypothetical protein